MLTLGRRHGHGPIGPPVLELGGRSISSLKQGNMKGDHRACAAADPYSLGRTWVPEIAAPLVERVKPLLNDFEQIQGIQGALLSDINDFECKLKTQFEN